MQELKFEQVEDVNGGISDDTGYAVAVGASIAFVALAVATGGTVALAAVAASYFSTGMAFSYAD
jgi:hypothetical protein